MTNAAPAPLSGIRVLDFSTLVPGPLATLVLAEAGAEVVKVERPDGGDPLRAYPPVVDGTSAIFALLNRGKRSVALDLKRAGAFEALSPLLTSADIVVEQFRPGVMDRLGLGYDAVRRRNPRVVYCSITGFGQSGPRALQAGHDLSYLAASGLLALTRSDDGGPIVPPVLIADIAGGSYPAVINILLALLRRHATGVGCHLDLSMSDAIMTLTFWALAAGFSTGEWPAPGGALLSGGSPRYNVYRTLDDRFLAVAALEDKFWEAFCAAIELPEPQRDDHRDPAAVKRVVAERLATRTGDAWETLLRRADTCAALVTPLRDAIADPHLVARSLFCGTARAGDRALPALPVPLTTSLRPGADDRAVPALGEGNAQLLGKVAAS